jgi:hypothetical protein
MAAMGHEARFPPRKSSGGCPFGQQTFAATRGKEQDAPISDLPALAPERGSSTSKPPFAARDIDRRGP